MFVLYEDLIGKAPGMCRCLPLWYASRQKYCLKYYYCIRTCFTSTLDATCRKKSCYCTFTKIKFRGNVVFSSLWPKQLRNVDATKRV